MSFSYDNPIVMTYEFLASAAISSEADIGKISGPAGKTGRVLDVTTVVTTGVTDAAGVISLGDGTDEDAYGTLSVPVSSAGAVKNGLVAGVDETIPADAAVTVHGGGEATAGAVNVFVVIAWF